MSISLHLLTNLDRHTNLLAQVTDNAKTLLVVGTSTAHPDSDVVLTELLLELTESGHDT